MKIVRSRIFETNSSSTHSLTLCSNELYQDWLNGKAYYIPEREEILEGDKLTKYIKEQIIISRCVWEDGCRRYKDKVYNYGTDTPKLLSEEHLAEITDQDVQDYLNSEPDDYYERPITKEEYDEHIISDQYEEFKESYITDTGEEVIAFGYYGMD